MSDRVDLRLFLRRNGKIEDMKHDISLADYGGVAPAIGDRFVEVVKPGPDIYRVVDRIFDTIGDGYIMLVLEETEGSDLSHLTRYHVA